MVKSLPAVNVQYPWPKFILEGAKTIETRFYPLPRKYIGKEMALIQTPGKLGNGPARIVGVITFGEPFPYKNETHFSRDRKRHLVQSDTPDFSWASGNGKIKWGWPILEVKKLDQSLPSGLRRGIVFTQEVRVNA